MQPSPVIGFHGSRLTVCSSSRRVWGDLQGAGKRASDTVDRDDFPGAAEALRAVEASSQRAPEIIARQGRALAEDRARAGP